MSTFCIYALDQAAAASHAADLRAKGMRAMVRNARTFGGPKDRENCDIVVMLDGEFPDVAAAYEGRAHILTKADLDRAAKAVGKKERGDDGNRTEDAPGKPGRRAAAADGEEDGDDPGEADDGQAGGDAQPVQGERVTGRGRPRRARK